MGVDGALLGTAPTSTRLELAAKNQIHKLLVSERTVVELNKLIQRRSKMFGTVDVVGVQSMLQVLGHVFSTSQT